MNLNRLKRSGFQSETQSTAILETNQFILILVFLFSLFFFLSLYIYNILYIIYIVQLIYSCIIILKTFLFFFSFDDFAAPTKAFFFIFFSFYFFFFVNFRTNFKNFEFVLLKRIELQTPHFRANVKAFAAVLFTSFFTLTEVFSRHEQMTGMPFRTRIHEFQTYPPSKPRTISVGLKVVNFSKYDLGGHENILVLFCAFICSIFIIVNRR